MNDTSNCSVDEEYQCTTLWYELRPLKISKYETPNTENCKIDRINCIVKFSSTTNLYIKIIHASLMKHMKYFT